MQIDAMCRPSIFYKTDIFLKVEIMNIPLFQSSDCLCVKHADMKQVFVLFLISSTAISNVPELYICKSKKNISCYRSAKIKLHQKVFYIQLYICILSSY